MMDWLKNSLSQNTTVINRSITIPLRVVMLLFPVHIAFTIVRRILHDVLHLAVQYPAQVVEDYWKKAGRQLLL